jgi:hypothetical protein
MYEKKIDQMAQMLKKKKLGDRIPKDGKKKNSKYMNPKKGNSRHALIFINSSLVAWIVDSRASHHLVAKK